MSEQFNAEQPVPDAQPAVDRLQDETLAEEQTTIRPPTGGITPGWYPNPADTTEQRYWDGEGWIGPALPASIPPPLVGASDGFGPQYPEGTDEVTLVDQKIHILPVRRWKSAAMSAMYRGDYELWAEGALAGDEYRAVWCQVNPDMDEVNTMFIDLNGKRPPGKSSRARR